MENDTDNKIVVNDEKEQTSVPAKSTGAVVRKVLGIALEVVLYLFLAFALFMLIAVLSSKKSDGAIGFFGYEMRIVASSSMEKSDNSVDVSDYKIKDLKVKSLVIIERLPQDEQKAKEWYSELKEGDVLTFKYKIGSGQETITHRIVKITQLEHGYKIELRGDNRTEGADVGTQIIYTSPDDYPSNNEYFNYVIGKVVGNSTAAGYLIYAVKQPVGTAFIIIVPCCIIIIWQVVRIVNALSEDKKKKAAEKADAEREKAEKEREIAENKAKEQEDALKKQAQELEELKRKFAELTEKTGSADGDKSEPEPDLKQTDEIADNASDSEKSEESETDESGEVGENGDGEN